MRRSIISFFTGRKKVLLLDNRNKVYKTLEYKKNPFNDLKTCPVYYKFDIGYVILKDDGTCTGESTYIKKWMYG